MKKTYHSPIIDVVGFSPEILEGPNVTSVGTSGRVDNDDTGSGSWDFGGDGSADDEVGVKSGNLWDAWDE